MIAAGIGLEYAGIDRKALTLNQAHGHRRPDNPLEDVAQYVALAEAAQSVEREGRMVRDLVLEIEPTEPPICEVKLNFLGEPALRADAVAVAHDEHTDHELRIDRGTPDLAVVGLQLLVEVGQSSRHDQVYPAQKMTLRNAIIEAELIEQLTLVPPLPPHHRRIPVANLPQQTESPFGASLNAFIDSIDPKRTFWMRGGNATIEGVD
jgi:hypothetical protein